MRKLLVLGLVGLSQAGCEAFDIQACDGFGKFPCHVVGEEGFLGTQVTDYGPCPQEFACSDHVHHYYHDYFTDIAAGGGRN